MGAVVCSTRTSALSGAWLPLGKLMEDAAGPPPNAVVALAVAIALGDVDVAGVPTGDRPEVLPARPPATTPILVDGDGAVATPERTKRSRRSTPCARNCGSSSRITRY